MNTFLFDLDGTLLPLEDGEFEQLYFKTLSEKAAHLIEGKELVSHIWSSIKDAIINIDPTLSNETIFYERFKERVGDQLFARLEPIFNDYYENDFIKVKAATSVSQEMIESIQVLKDKGYHVAIVTNPLFPRSAIHQRVQWAGFSVDDFVYITSFEDNHFAKPQPYLYEEVLSHLNLKPSDCMMVGNHPIEDLVASTLGIKTYLITDNLQKVEEEKFTPDHKGSRKEFLEYVKSLPTI